MPLPLGLRAAACLALVLPLAAPAALKEVTPSGFLVSHAVELKAAPDAVYAALGRPDRWWNPEHTYSGHRENLQLRLQARGCFCEAWDRNAVVHAQVIQLVAGKRLRLEGALGPLQEMAVNAVLDFRIDPRAGGSTLTMTYRVRGSAEAKLEKVAPAVERVMVDQVQRLAAFVDAGAAEGAKAQSLERRMYEANGVRLPFVEQGSTGDPVILLHDAGSTIERQWIDTGVMRTAATQFRVIAAEARGPEDVVKLMDQLQLARAHVAGYGEGAQVAAKLAVTHPARVQTLTLAGSTSLRTAAAAGARADLVVADADMIALTAPTLGIVGTKDPAMRDFIELKAVMPRFVRMIAIADATHEAAPASPDFAVALMYFMRYHPISP